MGNGLGLEIWGKHALLFFFLNNLIFNLCLRISFLTFAATWMDLRERLVLREVSQTETNTLSV